MAVTAARVFGAKIPPCAVLSRDDDLNRAATHPIDFFPK